MLFMANRQPPFSFFEACFIKRWQPSLLRGSGKSAPGSRSEPCGAADGRGAPGGRAVPAVAWRLLNGPSISPSVRAARPTASTLIGCTASRAADRPSTGSASAAFIPPLQLLEGRDYILQGLIPIVDMPPLRLRPGDARKQTLRRVLVDRADLDAFVESRKRPR